MQHCPIAPYLPTINFETWFPTHSYSLAHSVRALITNTKHQLNSDWAHNRNTSKETDRKRERKKAQYLPIQISNIIILASRRRDPLLQIDSEKWIIYMEKSKVVSNLKSDHLFPPPPFLKPPIRERTNNQLHDITNTRAAAAHTQFGVCTIKWLFGLKLWCGGGHTSHLMIRTLERCAKCSPVWVLSQN